MGTERRNRTDAPTADPRRTVSKPSLELTTADAASRLRRSQEFVRLAYRDGRLLGREEELGGHRTRIWIDRHSVEAMAAALRTAAPPGTVAHDGATVPDTMSSADIRIALLEGAITDAKVAAVLAENRRLEQEVERLGAKIDALLDLLREGQSSTSRTRSRP
jgi:hypothetical protein